MSFIKDIINFLSSPKIFVSLSILFFFFALRTKRLWSAKYGLIALIIASVFLSLSMLDEDFRAIITKPDNVAIVAMLFSVLFFVWLSLKQALENDRRLTEGKEVVEKEFQEKALVWPNLVYIELIVMVIATIVLILWSIGLEAPIEEPGNPAKSPNPAKAPWYFVGFQELLVYYDPWIAGVVVPGLIILGLMAIPYLDRNPKGNGYYTFAQRRFAIIVYLFGFLVLWILPIIIGTFLRGPNWNFFGPYEYWDVHKLEPLVNVNLSELIYVKLLGVGLPEHWFLREIFGIITVVFYLVFIPWFMARRWFRGFYEGMGLVRYIVMMALLLVMVSIPIKMYLRWALNIKYIIAIPEYFFNI